MSKFLFLGSLFSVLAFSGNALAGIYVCDVGGAYPGHVFVIDTTAGTLDLRHFEKEEGKEVLAITDIISTTHIQYEFVPSQCQISKGFSTNQRYEINYNCADSKAKRTGSLQLALDTRVASYVSKGTRKGNDRNIVSSDCTFVK